MITFFKYSKKRFPPLILFTWAVGTQATVAVLAACTFQGLGLCLGKTNSLGEILALCCIGVLAGFLTVAVSAHPMSHRQIHFVSILSIGFSFFYWLVSSSVADIWLSHLIAGFGIGVLTAAIYRLLFMDAPILPRVK